NTNLDTRQNSPMKTSFLLLLLAPFAAMAQFTDDLATKRTDLVYQLRDLGPLPPNNWINSGVLWVVNGQAPVTEYSYHFMGNYNQVGTIGSEYLFGYHNSGVWSISNPSRANTGARFDHFGLH